MPGIADILAGLNGTMSDPSSAGLTGFAQGLLQASAPHMLTPVSMGQALGQGAASSQQYQSQALQNAMARLSIPFQQMKVQTFAKALKTLNDPKASDVEKAQARALAANLISPGMGGAMLSNSPEVQGAKENAISRNKPLSVSPSVRVFGPHGDPSVGAQGALPEGTHQDLGTLDLSFLPGAPGAIAANAANKAGGAAAATFPYQAGLSYHTRAPGAAGGTLGPRPPPFVPVGGSPPQPQQPSPVALQAAQAAARQRQAAIAQAAPQPSTPAPQAQPPPPVAAPAASGGGLNSHGMTPGQVAMSTGQGQQAVETNAGYQKQAEDAKETLAQVAELRMAAHDFTPGQFAESRIKGLQWLQSLGLITPKEAQALGSAQEGTKMQIQLQSTLTRSLGNREAAQVFATLGRGVPNLTLSPDGFSKMTAYMEGMARYNVARAQRAQQAFNGGDIAGVNNVRNQYIANSNPAYFIIASAPPQTQREMIAQMGSKAPAFLQKWAQATAAGWAPSPTAFASQP